MSETFVYVFAHPDDETFSCGGTIARNRDRGFRQVLFCATHGEAGKTGNPPICKQEELGLVRKEELQRAVDILGIDELILRDYGDGKLDQSPFSELVDDLVQLFKKEQPSVVITFPPSGISGHKDHQVIQQATFAAMEKIPFNSSLYYIVVPESIGHSRHQKLHTTPDDEVTDQIDVTPYQEIIYQASLQHRSQHLSFEKAFPEVFRDKKHKTLRTYEFFKQITGDKKSRL